MATETLPEKMIKPRQAFEERDFKSINDFKDKGEFLEYIRPQLREVKHPYVNGEKTVRPYVVGFGCDGSTDANIHYVAQKLAKDLGWNYEEIYNKAYPDDRGGTWIQKDLSKSKDEALKSKPVTKTTVIPRNATVQNVLDDLYDINNRSLVEELENRLEQAKIPLNTKLAEVKPFTPPKPTPAKESWQMTQKEYVGDLSETFEPVVFGTQVGSKVRWRGTGEKAIAKQKADILRGAPEAHRSKIRQALAEGKPVPAEVLKDYPELAVEGREQYLKTQALKEHHTLIEEEIKKAGNREVGMKVAADRLEHKVDQRSGVVSPENIKEAKLIREAATVKDVTPKGYGPSGEGEIVSPRIEKRKDETLDEAITREVGYQIDNGRVKLTEDRDGWKATVAGLTDDKPHVIRAYKKQQVLNEVWKYLNPDYVAPKPEAKKEEYTPVGKLPDNELLRLYKIPEHRDMPQDYKDYLTKARAEFDKRDIKLGSTLSAKPSNYPEIKVKPLPEEGSIISRGNMIPIAYEIGGKKYKTSAVLAPTRGKSMELHNDIYFGRFKVGTGREITKAHIDKGIELAKAFTLPETPARPEAKAEDTGKDIEKLPTANLTGVGTGDKFVYVKTKEGWVKGEVKSYPFGFKSKNAQIQLLEGSRKGNYVAIDPIQEYTKVRRFVGAQPETPAEAKAKIDKGDFIKQEGTSYTGIVQGEGSIGKIPAWKVQGPRGETSLISKTEAKLIAKEKPTPPKAENKGEKEGPHWKDRLDFIMAHPLVVEAEKKVREHQEKQAGRTRWGEARRFEGRRAGIQLDKLAKLRERVSKAQEKARKEYESRTKPEPKEQREPPKPTFTLTKGPKRSDRAMAIDQSLLAKRVVTVDDPRWLKHPNRLDVRGVDTPSRARPSRGVYADKGRSRMSRKPHRNWRRIY